MDHQLTGFPDLDLVGQVDDLIRDDRIVLERPIVGPRVLAIVTSNEPVKFFWADGSEMRHPQLDVRNLIDVQTVMRRIARTAGETYTVTLDGELAPAGEIHLMDVLRGASGTDEVIVPGTRYVWRRAWLDDAAQAILGEDTPVRVRAQARTRRAKTVLLETLRAEGVDRVLARHLDHPYQPGRMSTGAASLRFVRTADLVVTAINWSEGGTPVFTLGAYDGRPVDHVHTLRPVWRGSIPSHGDVGLAAIASDIGPGTVVEVSYLHWTGRTLYQPEPLRIKYGVDQFDCALDQFPDYTRETFTFPTPESETPS